MDVIRRQLLTEVGEPLAVSPSPIETALRYGGWLAYSGLTPDETMANPMSSVPLPVYPQEWDLGLRRWPGVNAGAMWHPLMWLPNRLAGRYSLPDGNGGYIIESDDLYAIRLAYELTASGLYDENTAGWLDVLAMVNIDVDDPTDLARVQSWLDGAADAALDELSVQEILDSLDEYKGDPDWAMSLAAENLGPLRIIAWASSSQQLILHLEDLKEDLHAGDPAPDMTSMRRSVVEFTHLAAMSLRLVPGGGAEPGAEGQWWLAQGDQIEQFTGTVQELMAGPVESMISRLEAIREHFMPQMERFAEIPA
ncbi:MAG: hypothetical protein WKF57_06490 [Nakamurella sp.]